MARVKTSVTTRKRYRLARESLTHALAYSTAHRRLKKRQNRSLQITRINAASRINGISYSQLMYGIKSSGINLDRKSLSDLAIYEPEVFSEIVSKVKTEK